MTHTTQYQPFSQSSRASNFSCLHNNFLLILNNSSITIGYFFFTILYSAHGISFTNSVTSLVISPPVVVLSFSFVLALFKHGWLIMLLRLPVLPCRCRSRSSTPIPIYKPCFFIINSLLITQVCGLGKRAKS